MALTTTLAHIAAEGPGGGFTISDATAVIGLLTTIGAGVGGYFVKYLLSRRANSGDVRTSDAKTVFEQMQAMITTERDRADKAYELVDKLIDSQGTKVAPSLAEISSSLEDIAATETQLVAMLSEALQAKGPAYAPTESAVPAPPAH